MTMNPIESAAHVVQLSLAPIFLLSGIAALLNVFASRLGRVADQADALKSSIKDTTRDGRLELLRLRSHALDVAVVTAALAGMLTCSTVLVLFLGEVLGKGGPSLLYLLFGGGIVLSMASLLAFVVEMLLAAVGVRRLVAHSFTLPSLHADRGSRRADADESR
jgi:hypothetical protein